jgi:hypothetical protein
VRQDHAYDNFFQEFKIFLSSRKVSIFNKFRLNTQQHEKEKKLFITLCNKKGLSLSCIIKRISASYLNFKLVFFIYYNLATHYKNQVFIIFKNVNCMHADDDVDDDDDDDERNEEKGQKII